MENADIDQNANSKARAFIDEAYYSFSVVNEDETRLPGSEEEIEQARGYIEQAKALSPDEEEVQELISDYEGIFEESFQRKFVGFKWLMILVAVYAGFLFYVSRDSFKSSISEEQAKNIMANSIASYQKSIELNQNKPDSLKAEAEENIEIYDEKIAELEAMTPKQYIKDYDKRHRRRGWRNLFKGIIWIGFIGLYWYASRPPQFIINKRRRQIEMVHKGGNIIRRITFFILGFFIAMPVTMDTVTHWSDGTKTRETDFSPLLMIKIMGIAIIVIFAVYISIILLPILTLINYLRNYQYKKVDQYFDKAVNWFKDKFASAKQKVTEQIES